mmetsp:Transcript_112781/g.224333  ORF Transcript_112781/g.224333 Transcript_112781/m.224333 type:complete len:130 (+) Transcript_112781:98-487(+)
MKCRVALSHASKACVHAANGAQLYGNKDKCCTTDVVTPLQSYINKRRRRCPNHFAQKLCASITSPLVKACADNDHSTRRPSQRKQASKTQAKNLPSGTRSALQGPVGVLPLLAGIPIWRVTVGVRVQRR